jgi:O-succinylbenzoate synthase
MEIEGGRRLRYGFACLKLLLRFRRYRLPFLTPVRTSRGPWAEREGLLLRLEDESGRAGWGEAAPIPSFGTETADEAESACRALGGWMEEGLLAAPAGMRCVAAGLRAARADLETGRTTDWRAGPGAWPVCALLPAGAGALPVLAAKAESDFRVFKWKVGAGNAGDELALLDDLCGLLPAGARLRLDANGAWDRRMAGRWLDRCAGRPVEFVEQPVAPEARGAEDLLLGLAGDYPTPLALDESLGSDDDVGRWLDLGWKGVFVVKPSLHGDLRPVLERLETAGAAVVFSSALETAVGARSALLAAFSWRGVAKALGFGVWPLFSDSTFDGPAAAPFLRCADIECIKPEILWNALN